MSLRPSLWLGLLAVARGAAAQDCIPFVQSSLDSTFPDEDYTPLCLDPDVTASASIDLDSLFPDGAKLVYAIQEYDEDDILDLATDELITGTPDDLVNAGVWFEYSKSNFDTSAETLTDFDVDFVYDLDGTTEGGNGGCDGVFGKECSDALLKVLKDYLWESTIPTGRRPTTKVNLNYAWSSVTDTDREKCPDALENARFSNQLTIAFEAKTDKWDGYMFPSGNKSWAYITEEHENTLEYEKAATAFAIILQWPFVEELVDSGFEKVPEDKFFTKNDISVSFACIKHDKTKKTDDSQEDSDGESSGGDDSGSESDADNDDDAAPSGARVELLLLTSSLVAVLAIGLL